jgi:hypothetical protein
MIFVFTPCLHIDRQGLRACFTVFHVCSNTFKLLSCFLMFLGFSHIWTWSVFLLCFLCLQVTRGEPVFSLARLPLCASASGSALKAKV